MKLTYFQFDAHLAQKNLHPLYLISGDEWLLKQDALNALRKQGKEAGFSEHIRVSEEVLQDGEQLYALLHATSLLAEKRLIEINFQDSLPNKSVSQILIEYTQKPLADNLIVIETGKLDSKTNKSTWYQALEKIGIALTIWSVSREQLPQWISQRAKKYKLQINSEGIAFIANYAEGNLIAAAQLLEKIFLFKPEQTISALFLKELFSDESRYTVFDLGEYLIANDKSRLLKILQNLENDGVEPVLVLWSIVRELRMLAEMKLQLNQGEKFETVCKAQRIFPRRQNAIRTYLINTSADDCLRKLVQATEIDKFIKGAKLGNVWQTLQLFAMAL